MKIFELIGLAQDMRQKRRVSSAKAVYEHCLREYPEAAPLVCYDLGCLHFMFTGDGEAARCFFQRAVEERQRCEDFWPKENLDQLEANACENLMLLSLSYDEYDSWSRRLEKLQPKEAILHGQRPRVHDMRERAIPWHSVLSWMTDRYYHFTDPTLDSGHHAKAAATFQLMLLYRKQLRLACHDYWVTTGLYGSLLSWACSNFGVTMERSTEGVDPSEVRFMLEPGIPLIEEAVRNFPADQHMQQLADHLLKHPALTASAYGQSAPWSPLVLKIVSPREEMTMFNWLREWIVNTLKKLSGIPLLEPKMPHGTVPEANIPPSLAGTPLLEPKMPHLTYPEHYDQTARKALGENCELTLIHAAVEGQLINLVYQWNGELSDVEADRLDTRVRAYIACAIYDAAETADLRCQPGPPHGQRPSWYIKGESIPVSLVQASFDVSDRTCSMQIGPRMSVLARRNESGRWNKQLVAGLQAQFRRIRV